jgi:hypothetical protein
MRSFQAPPSLPDERVGGLGLLESQRNTKSIRTSTIYFLSEGNIPITNIKLCDLVPDNSTFIPNSFSSAPESGIGLAIGSTLINLTNVPDGDGGEFFIPGATPSVTCPVTNTNGAVVVQVVKSPVTLPAASGSPGYGLIRFRARVK